MTTDEERFVELTRKIYRLYHDHVDSGEVFNLLKDQEISFKFVSGVYHQLSANAKKSIRNRLYYYTIGSENYSNDSEIDCWTSRYLLAYNKTSSDPTFHEIKIIDSLNDKSMWVYFIRRYQLSFLEK
jgi:hypothetical protein